MTALIAWLKHQRGTEPVRLILWPAIGLLVAYGVQRGVVTGDVASYVLPVLAIVLGVPATAVVRSQVTPSAKVPDFVRKAARDALTEVVSKAAPQVDTTIAADALDTVITAVEQHVGKHRATP